MCSKINTGASLFVCEGKEENNEKDKVKCKTVDDAPTGIDHVTQPIEIFRRITKDECKAKLNGFKEHNKFATAAQWIPGQCAVDSDSKDALKQFSDTLPVITRDYQNRGEAYTYREYSCPGGYTLQHGYDFDFDKMTNQCGSSSWQRPLITTMNMPLTEDDKECCNDHDTCYLGYDRDGNSMIQDNKFSNEKCERDFHACMKAGNNSVLGKMYPTATSVASPSYFTLDWNGAPNQRLVYCMKPDSFNASNAEQFCKSYDESPSECNQTNKCKHQGNVDNLGTCYTYTYSCSKNVFGKQVIRQDFFTAIGDFFSKIGDIIKIR